MPTVDQHVRAFLAERRLTVSEVDAVMKIVKGDALLGAVGWGNSEDSYSPDLLNDIRRLVAGKVLAWMNKYHEKHPARALFTGES